MSDLLWKEIYYVTDDASRERLTSKAENKDLIISECEMTYSNRTWVISIWRTDPDHKHHGYGKAVLKNILRAAYNAYGEPDEVRYIWNGAHQYVMDWLSKNFDPVCIMPMAAKKENETDSWENHIYILDKEKVFNYFNVKD